jgi:hypothetical protein
MSGRGRKTFANGDDYLGEWTNDKANGRGVKVFSKGDRHEGYHKDDKRSGFGVYMWKAGDSYEGTWIQVRSFIRLQLATRSLCFILVCYSTLATYSYNYSCCVPLCTRRRSFTGGEALVAVLPLLDKHASL